MPKSTKVEKWLFYFNQFKKLPDSDIPDLGYDAQSFGKDYFNMGEKDKDLLWNGVRDLKYKENINKKDIHKILTNIYSREKVFDLHNLTPLHIEKVIKIIRERHNPQAKDISQLIQVAPIFFLREFMFYLQISYWMEFISLKDRHLGVPRDIDSLKESGLFGNFDSIKDAYIDLEGKFGEHFINGIPNHITMYIKKYCHDLYIPIMRNIDLTSDFLFCPELIISIINDTGQNDKRIISYRIEEEQLKMSDLQLRGFILPSVINDNITLLKKVVSDSIGRKKIED